ncbi:MAG: hypothetical protein GY839_16125 [candidate division Zixibacteria bacterium]|nr:hypothetical protein [candidate division Zixibacteria bacterium]
MDLRFPYNSLLDLRHVTEIEIGEKDLVKIFRELTSGSRPHGSEKLAIVAENQKAFDLGYKYGETIKGMNKKVVVFFNVDVARKWLGLD